VERLAVALDFIIPLLKAGAVPYQITGGFAVYLYGGTREVNDIDIDLPRAGLNTILPKLRPFIDSGPERYRDSTWDIELVTLTFQGQVIDLTVAEDAYIMNQRTGAREPLRMNFESVRKVFAFGRTLAVQAPEDLIEYKSKIVHEEAKHANDVSVVRHFLKRSS